MGRFDFPDNWSPESRCIKCKRVIDDWDDNILNEEGRFCTGCSNDVDNLICFHFVEGMPGIGDMLMFTGAGKHLGKHAEMVLHPKFECLMPLFEGTITWRFKGINVRKRIINRVNDSSVKYLYSTKVLSWFARTSPPQHKIYMPENVNDPSKITDAICQPTIKLRDEEIEWAKDFLHGLRLDKPPVVFIPNSAGRERSRSLCHRPRGSIDDLEKCEELVKHISKDFSVLQFGWNGESEIMRKCRNLGMPFSYFFSDFKNTTHIWNLEIRKLAALYSQIGIYVGCDTGDAHIMKAVGGRCFVIYHGNHGGFNFQPSHVKIGRVFPHGFGYTYYNNTKVDYINWDSHYRIFSMNLDKDIPRYSEKLSYEDFCEKVLFKEDPLLYNADGSEKDKNEPRNLMIGVAKKFDITLRYKPRRIAELGSRLGYTCHGILEAVPQSSLDMYDCSFVHGKINDAHKHLASQEGGLHNPDYDFHRDSLGLCENKIKERFPSAQIRTIDKDLRELRSLEGKYDMVHIDCCHDYEGTMHLLNLAYDAIDKQSNWLILVDDFFHLRSVQDAALRFQEEKGLRGHSESSYRGEYLLYANTEGQK